MNGRTITYACLLLALQTARAQAEPSTADAGSARARKTQPPFSLVQTLYSTTELKRMNVLCHGVDEPKNADDRAESKLRCAFFTVSLAQLSPERMATFENYSEILREWRAQCRSATTRTEQARTACAACARDLSETCLYVEAMKLLKRDCSAPVRASAHENPVVRAFVRAETEQARDKSSVTARFCAACVDDPSAQCFSKFWHDVPTPSRCTLSTRAFELVLERQKQTMAWTHNLGDACNTQVVLSYDDQHRSWTFRQLALTPEKCASDERAGSPAGAPDLVYSSAARYALPELAVLCERMTFAP